MKHTIACDQHLKQPIFICVWVRICINLELNDVKIKNSLSYVFSDYDNNMSLQLQIKFRNIEQFSIAV